MKPQGLASRKKAFSCSESRAPAQPKIAARWFSCGSYLTRQSWPPAFSLAQKAAAASRLAKPETAVR